MGLVPQHLLSSCGTTSHSTLSRIRELQNYGDGMTEIGQDQLENAGNSIMGMGSEKRLWHARLPRH